MNTAGQPQQQASHVLFISTQLQPLPSKQSAFDKSTLPRLQSPITTIPDAAAADTHVSPVSPGLQQDISLSLRIRALLAQTAQSILSPGVNHSEPNTTDSSWFQSTSPSASLIPAPAELKRPEAPQVKGILKTSSLNRPANQLAPLYADLPLKARSQTLPINLPSQQLKKQFRFNETVTVGEAISKDDYERKSDYQLLLTPELAMEIKKELNYFKQFEMSVHQESRHYTHLFKM